MAKDASEALGVPQTAGTFVSPKGLTRRVTAQTAGRVVGGVVGSMIASTATGGGKYAGAPAFGDIGYVAATADEVAIVRGKAGAFSPRSATGSLRASRGARSPPSSSTSTR